MISLGYYVLNLLLLPLAVFFMHIDQEACFWCYLVSCVSGLLFLAKPIRRGGILFLLTPCVFCFIYFSFNCVLGSLFYAITTDFNILPSLAIALDKIPDLNLRIGTLIMLLSNTMLCGIASRYAKRNQAFYNPLIRQNNGGVGEPKRSRSVEIVISLFSVVLFSMIYVDISFLGGSKGNSNYAFVLGASIVLVYEICKSRLSKVSKYVAYFVLFALFTVANYDSKRNGLFLLIVILLIVCLDTISDGKMLTLRFKHAVIAGVLSVGVFFGILASSVMRGYGGYDVDTYTDAITKVPEYINETYFLEAIAYNLEYGYDYGHTINCINYSLDGRIPVLYGLTFAKVFFIPIPRSVFPGKPHNMIEYYTMQFDSGFRQVGGSYPVLLPAELFANFSFLFPLFFLMLFVLLEKSYYRIMSYFRYGNNTPKMLIYVAFYCLLTQMFRGSGLDLLVTYWIFASFSIMLLMTIFKLLKLPLK